MKKISAVLRNLTLDDLREWAGAKILSRGKSYVRNVGGLSRTEDGALAAWVSGSEEYATSVHLDQGGDFDYSCSCPYDWGPCKHTVAVVLAAAEEVKQKRDIPLLAEDDDLFQDLFDDSDDDYEDYDERPEEDEESEFTATPATGKGKARLQKIFEGMDREELMALLMDLSCRYPEIERGLLEKKQVATGRVDKVVTTLRREIRNITAEQAWHNPWKDEGNLPDYSHVREQLQALLANGHADAVLQLGEELWTRGNTQVEQSNDDGDTATAIAECMEVVLRAVPQSSLTLSQQLMWVIDHVLADEFSLLESGGKMLESRAYSQTHWREVADILEARLKSMTRPASAAFSETYRRSGVLNMLLNAFERSGRRKEIIPLLEKEADVCRCYGKLVDALLAAGEKEKARQWCIRGFERTVENASGIAAELQGRLREMAEKEKKYDLAASYRAEDFFSSASLKTYTELRKAAEKAKVWHAVRGFVLRYLETGQRPNPSGKGKESKVWPLPTPEVMRPQDKSEKRYERFPNLDMLIGIAILERRFDDVVALYQELKKTKRWGWETDKAVAEAVSETHPQTTLDIWRAIAESLIGQVKPKAYEEAAIYLRRMCKVYQETRRASDWQNLLGELRREHKAKRRLRRCSMACQGKRSPTEADLYKSVIGMIDTKHPAWAIMRFCRQRLQLISSPVRTRRRKNRSRKGPWGMRSGSTMKQRSFPSTDSHPTTCPHRRHPSRPTEGPFGTAGADRKPDTND